MKEKRPLIPVTDNPNLGRDPASGAIINTNQSEYEKYMKSLKAEQKREQTIESLQNDVSALKSELGDIKSILLQIANNKGLNYDD